jgi:hypothetical protein
MPTFGDIALGSLARRPITVVDPRAGEMSFHVRYLDDTDDDQIEQGAEKFALARGATMPTQGTPLPSGAAQNPWRGNAHYERGYVLYTLLVAAVDPDSSQEQPRPFFRAIEQIQKLHPDTISQIFLAQRIFQSDMSPSLSEISGRDLLPRIVEIAISEDERPFVRLVPSLQWTLVRTMAVLVLSSHGSKLLSTWDSVKNSTDSIRRRLASAVDAGEEFEPILATPSAKTKIKPQPATAAGKQSAADRNKAKQKRRAGR